MEEFHQPNIKCKKTDMRVRVVWFNFYKVLKEAKSFLVLEIRIVVIFEMNSDWSAHEENF